MTPDGPAAQPLTTQEIDLAKDSVLGDRFMLRFSEDTLRYRPLWLRVIVEFVGTFILGQVAAGSGVINHYVGTDPISRTAAVIAPGAVVMALIYALGPLSGLHINPAVTLAFTGRRVFKVAWVLPYLGAQFAGAVAAALFLQGMYTNVSAGGNYPIATPGGDWRSLVMEIVLTAILATVILTRRPAIAASGTTPPSPSASDGRPAGTVRQPHQRGVHEPGPDPRPRYRLVRLHGVVDLHRRTLRRGRPGGDASSAC